MKPAKPFGVVYIWNNKHKVYDGVWKPRDNEFKKFVKYFLGIQKSTSDASKKKMKEDAALKAAEEAAKNLKEALEETANRVEEGKDLKDEL